MPGRHSIYPEGVPTVSVPLTISEDEANALWSVAPSRAAAVRSVVRDRVAAMQAVETMKVPDTLPAIYDALAAAARAAQIANNLGTDTTALVEFISNCTKKAGRLKRGGLTVA